jgi:hypothetical protein
MRDLVRWWSDVHMTRWGLWADPKPPPFLHRLLRGLVNVALALVLVGVAHKAGVPHAGVLVFVPVFVLVTWIQTRVGRIVNSPHRHA